MIDLLMIAGARWRRVALLVVGTLVLAGCASGVRKSSGSVCSLPGVTCVTVVLPPALAAAGGLRKVAVAPGTGVGAGSMTTHLRTLLSEVAVDDQPYYTLLRPYDSQLEATFEVSSTAWGVTDQPETQERRKCLDKKCKESTPYNVNCTVRKATVGTLVRLRDKTGMEIATRAGAAVSSSTQCQGEQGTLDSATVLLASASAKAMEPLHDALAVRTVSRRVRVMDDTLGISDPARKVRFDQGVAFAKAGRMDRACPIFADLSEIEIGSVSVFYNLGFCDQASGKWRDAFKWYSKADSIANKPMSELKEALDETRPYGNQR